jgi:transposase
MSGLAEIIDENRRLREKLEVVGALVRERDDRLQERGEQLREKDEQLREKDEQIATQSTELAKREAMIEAVKERAEELARKLALIELKARGPASQRFVPEAQTALPFPGDIDPPPRAPVPDDEDGTEDEPTGKKPRKGKKTPKRRSREDFRHLDSRPMNCKASDIAASGASPKAYKVIGQAVSFRIEWVSGHFVVIDVSRDKCVDPDRPGQGVLTVPAPFALDRALCGNGLLARVLVDKFCDHIPLNRQARRMKREGFEVGTNTLSGWVCGGAKVLDVLANTVRLELLAGDYLQGDDTGLPVQDGTDGTLRKGRLWAFTDQEQVFYAFTPTKEGIYPAELLEGFTGDLLLVDGGSEFNKVVRDLNLLRAGCWSHLRTYFFDARLHHPVEAALALGTIHDLFMIERCLHGQDPAQTLEGRRLHAKPLVDGFFDWVRGLSTVVRPKSQLGKAVTYARNQEQAMRLFLEHGQLPLHNNLSELMLRQAVVGRKNWLFAGSEGGAQAAAAIYTLVGSCMLQGIDPHEYLVDVLGTVLDHPVNRVVELTPKAWRKRQGHTSKGR